MLPGAGTCSRAIPLPTICNARPAVLAASTATRRGSPRNEGTPTRFAATMTPWPDTCGWVAATVEGNECVSLVVSVACTGSLGGGGAGGETSAIASAFSGMIFPTDFSTAASAGGTACACSVPDVSSLAADGTGCWPLPLLRRG